MQTFLISTQSFKQTAKCLDNKRLNKQALEAWQIMMTNLSLDPQGNHRDPKGWVNHPAAVMWRGYEIQLYKYICAMTDEWESRGYKTTIRTKAFQTLERANNLGLIISKKFPFWIRDGEIFQRITASHRTALLSKNYSHYSQFDWFEDQGVAPESYEYIWPSKMSLIVGG